MVEIGPAYNKYLIQGYALSDTFHKPVIFVYPVDEYVQMVADVGNFVEELKSIINSPSQPMPENLPFLPAFNAGQVFHSNEQVIKFQNGTGVRLTQYAQAPYPVNNESLFYTFQGLTSDGAYYVSGDSAPSTPHFSQPMEIPKRPCQLMACHLTGITLRMCLSISIW